MSLLNVLVWLWWLDRVQLYCQLAQVAIADRQRELLDEIATEAAAIRARLSV